MCIAPPRSFIGKSGTEATFSYEGSHEWFASEQRVEQWQFKKISVY